MRNIFPEKPYRKSDGGSIKKCFSKKSKLSRSYDQYSKVS